MTIHQASKLWDISERHIAELCKNGTIEGAEKIKNRWIIPDWTLSPKIYNTNNTYNVADSEPAYIITQPTGGISEYEEVLQKNNYYVDKTMLIKELIDKNNGVYLITRPRRFGKSMNISMLQSFFEISKKDKTPLFCDKLIWKAGSRYTSLLGQFPVIKISLNNAQGLDWDETKKKIRTLVQMEYGRHSELKDNEKLNAFEKNFYNKIIIDDENTDWSISLKILSDMLYHVHGKKCIVLIDEYDTPIENSYARGYYDECINFMRSFYSYVLKDNPSMELGYMTGILRVAKESIFSGLNNIKVYSLLDDAFSSCFGYTENDVMKMAAYYGRTSKLQEIRSWYDGYRFGNVDIYNPWSVNSYFSANCKADSFWVHTSGNSGIGMLLKNADMALKRKFLALTEGETIKEIVNTNIVYPDMEKNPNAIFSFLLVTGYLKVSKWIKKGISGDIVELAIPNKEVLHAFIAEIIPAMNSMNKESIATTLLQAIELENIDALTTELKHFLMETVSFYDTSSEGFYQGLMIGFYSILSSFYDIRSNRESGFGRFDIALTPKKSEILPGIILELKTAKSKEELKARSNEALSQINEKEYKTEMLHFNIKRILKIGLAFHGKEAEVAYEIETI